MDIIKTMKELVDLAEKSNQKVSVAINFYSNKPYITFYHHDEKYEDNVEIYHIWNLRTDEEEDIEALKNIKSVLKQGVVE